MYVHLLSSGLGWTGLGCVLRGLPGFWSPRRLSVSYLPRRAPLDPGYQIGFCGLFCLIAQVLNTLGPLLVPLYPSQQPLYPRVDQAEYQCD